MLKMPFLFGNISKNQDAFSFRTQDGTKRKVLSKRDILMTLSITGAEFIIQRKDSPTNFEVADSRNLIHFIKRKLREPSTNFYVASSIFEVYKSELADIFQDRTLHVAHPASTRLRPQGSEASSFIERPNSSSSPQQRVSNIVEMDEEDETPVPTGLFQWLNQNSHTTDICKHEERSRYLTEARNNSSNFKDKCPQPVFDDFLRKLHCHPREQRKKCVRKLLLFTHADRFSNNTEKQCASEIFSHISDAKTNMETTYNMEETCQ